MNFLTQIEANLAHSEFYQNNKVLSPGIQSPVRLIAYYLPQFHPIPENDAWWGTGFTEWTNVTRGLPRFKGHYQPHLPGDLGFYDLRLPQVLRRQAELVRDHGLAGLCFHYYWFNGKPLLDMPIRLLLEHKDIELSFCVNWANENWSRRWDGNDQDILMRQTYSPEDDIAFAGSLEPLFRDPRYIRINGRPLLMLYRPSLLPDAKATVRRWRAHFESVGLGNPYVVMAQGFGDDDPSPYGMDAAAGFPPHRSGLDAPAIQGSLEYLDANFQGIVVQYADMVAAALARSADRVPLSTRGYAPLGTTRHASRRGAFAPWVQRRPPITIGSPLLPARAPSPSPIPTNELSSSMPGMNGRKALTSSPIVISAMLF